MAPQLLQTHWKREEKHTNTTKVRLNIYNITIPKKRTHSNLFEKCHGKLLMWDAVFGRTDVLLALVGDVEVDPHQEVLLEKTSKERLDLV